MVWFPPDLVGGRRPPFFFVVAKKNAPRPVEEKAVGGATRHQRVGLAAERELLQSVLWMSGACAGCAVGPWEQGECRPACGGVAGAFGVGIEWTCSSFRCRSPGTSATWAERQRRGGGSRISPAPRTSKAVRRGLMTGSFSKTEARAQRCRCPNLPGYLAKPPYLGRKFPCWGKFPAAGIFSFDRERPFSFRCIEKKMGVHSRAAKRRSPVPAPWADVPGITSLQRSPAPLTGCLPRKT